MADKVKVLADYLEIPESEISDGYSEDIFETTDGEEYLVCTDAEADEHFHDEFMSLVDDMGIELFSKDFQETILDNYCNDNDFWEDFWKEDYTYYAEDISSEDDDTYGNRLVQEAYDAGVLLDDDFEIVDGKVDYSKCTMDDDSIVDMYSDYLVDELEGNYADECKFQFGEETFNQLVKEHNLIDWDAVEEAVKLSDGRGPELSFYDGVENEHLYDGTWYYIYRTN